MWLYLAGMDSKPVDPELLKESTHTEAVYMEARGISGRRMQREQFDVEIEWDGLPDVEDRTWEPLKQIETDVLELLKCFLSSSGKWKLK